MIEKRPGQSDFSFRLEQLHQQAAFRTARIAEDTLADARLNILTANNRVKTRCDTGWHLQVKPPYCRSSRPCVDKRLKFTRNRTWRLCTSREGCNQQSPERRDGY